MLPGRIANLLPQSSALKENLVVGSGGMKLLIACAIRASFSLTPSLLPFGELAAGVASTATREPGTVSTLRVIGFGTTMPAGSNPSRVIDVTALPSALAKGLNTASLTDVVIADGAGRFTAKRDTSIPPYAVPS